MCKIPDAFARGGILHIVSRLGDGGELEAHIFYFALNFN
jgi:hypothetical protein